MSGCEMQHGGSEPGQASNSDDVQDVAASSSRLMRNGLEAMMHKLNQGLEGIPDDVRKFVSALVEEVVPSTVENYLIDWTRIMEREIDVLVTRKVHQAIPPIIEDLLPTIVKEAISSAVEKFRTDEGEVIGSTERNLELNFLVEVSAEVLTGKEIKGKEDATIRVALVDVNTGQVVVDGPEASAEVEILLLVLDPENEGLNNMIIPEINKTKPHFTKNIYVYLKKGVGFLCGVKLGHEARWTRRCSCRLRARIVNKFSGIKVKDALTEPFEVKDSRSKLYGKHYPPFLCDKVWRLDEIHKGGEPCKRLGREKVETVQDFLLLLRIDPQRLKEIVGASESKWKAIVDHAKTCSTLEDNKIYVHCSPSSSYGVTFDVVGELKGMICDSHFLPNNNLSEDEKARAEELLRLAFKNRELIESFDDEASLLDRFPSKSDSTVNFASVTNCLALDNPSTFDLTGSRSRSITVCATPPIELGTSSETFSPAIGQICELSLADPTGSPSPDPDEYIDYERLRSDICPSETLRPGSRIFVAVSVMIFRSRARKRVMALGNVCDNTKRQRIGCV